MHVERDTTQGSVQPRPLLGQEMRWIARADLPALDFPEADRALIEILSTQTAQSQRHT